MSVQVRIQNSIGEDEVYTVTEGIKLNLANEEGQQTFYLVENGTLTISDTDNIRTFDVLKYDTVFVDVPAGKILAGQSFLGVEGTATDDANADKPQILSGYTAYAKGLKVIGSIPTKTDTDLIVDGNTLTIPQGYYDDTYTKSIATGTASTPATTIDTSSGISASVDSATGAMTIDVNGSQLITPTVSTGYISEGIAGTVQVSGSYTDLNAGVIANNIRQGATVLGIMGTYAGLVPSGTEYINNLSQHDVATKQYA